MKLSEVSADRSGALIPKISEYSNKQNKVSDSDLFSNHEFHIKLEEISRRLKAPAKLGSQRQSSWFYERVKGQYRIETAKMSPSEKVKFELDNPKNQVITKTDIAKVDHSWRQLPNEVSKGAQKNFDLYSKLIVSEWAREPLQFNDEFFRKIVSQTIIFRELERIIPQQSWYDGGYRANIVTFTIAKLSNLIDMKALFVLGNCYSDLNNLDQALGFYNRCITLNKDEPDFYFKRAIVFGKKQNFKACLNDLIICTNLNSQYYEAFYWMGVAKINLKQNPCEDFKMFIALSYSKLNRIREAKYYEAKQKGYELISYVSSKCSYMSQYACGDNCFIFEDNTIQPFVKIGNNVTLWSGNHIVHHSVLNDHIFISSHVVISGHCRISSNSFIGVNATIGHQVVIANENIIGAGSIITKNTETGNVWVPSKSVKLDKLSNEINL
jgi:acetyltransferase-like isoleucine patch superfamily enzyme